MQQEESNLAWYRSAVKQAASSYKQDLSKFVRDERQTNQDENTLRRFAKEGHLFMFEYKAKMKYLPYYDKNPLVYVVKASPTEFFGANLHYMNPKKRIQAVQKLMKGRIDIPKVVSINTYRITLMVSFWILLPTNGTPLYYYLLKTL